MERFVLRGKAFMLDSNEVRKLLAKARTERKKTKYYVVIGRRELSVKCALEKVLKRKGIDLTLMDFTTQDAVRIFRKLGFPIVRRGRKEILRFAGAIKGGKDLDAVEDKRKIYD